MAIDSGDMDTPQVFDPTLGKKRDAFPGEIIPDEQQKTLNRLMAQGEAEFRTLYDAVAGTGQLNEDELNGILKAGKIRAEQKRLEYLEAIRTNPANLIASIYKGFLQPFPSDVDTSLIGLNAKIAQAQQFVDRERNADQIAGRAILETRPYVVRFIQQTPDNSNLIKYNKTGRSDVTEATNLALGVLTAIGALPSNIFSTKELYETIKRTGNPTSSALSNADESQFYKNIRNLSASKPGFTGIKANLFLDKANYNPVGLEIQASIDTWVQIIDTGQYAPIKP